VKRREKIDLPAVTEQKALKYALYHISIAEAYLALTPRNVQEAIGRRFLATV